MADNNYASSGEFQPPPGAPKLQLELWRRIFSFRCQQIQTLSPENLGCYANVIASDLKTSRHKQVGEGEGNEQRQIDLARGYYSSFFISHCPSQSVIAATDVARHVIALFYRSVDDRLSPDERVHGLDAVKRAFLFLENALKDQTLNVSSAQNDTSEMRTSSQSRTNPPPTDSISHKMSERQNGKSVEESTYCNADKEVTVQEKEGNEHTNKRRREEAGVPNNGEVSAKEQRTKSSRNDDAPAIDGKNTAIIRPSNQEEREEEEPTGIQVSDKLVSSRMSLTTQQATTVVEVVTDSPTLFPPASLPPPIPICSMDVIQFLPDNNSHALASASLEPRQSCALTYDAGFNFNGSGATLDDKSFICVRDRLEQWDPYWKVVKELGLREMNLAREGRKTRVATRTTSCVSAMKACTQNLPVSCALVNVDLPGEYNNEKSFDTTSFGVGANDNPWGITWGESGKTFKTGDRRLLLRMLPLTRTEYDKKHHSDNHQWPIGTFIQLSRGASQQALHITQRRQQSHDPTLWKGLCHPLDMTWILQIDGSPFSLKICAREVVEKAEEPKHEIGSQVSKVFEGDDGELRPFAGTIESYDEKYKLYKIVYEDGDAEELTYEEVSSIFVYKNDDHGVFLKGSYAVHLAVCEYIAPVDLYDQLIKSMQKISLEASREMAKRYLQSQTVSIDSDSEGGDSSCSSSLTLSLLCPLSMSAIKTAIRGRQCKHMQCFDMKTFLHYNKHISGGRWRCGVCEDFLSVRDLVQCGLYETMLLEYNDKVSSGYDKVSFRSDGSWSLKDENKPRHTSKNRGVGLIGDDLEKGKFSNGSCQKRLLAQPDVIDLL